MQLRALTEGDDQLQYWLPTGPGHLSDVFTESAFTLIPSVILVIRSISSQTNQLENDRQRFDILKSYRVNLRIQHSSPALDSVDPEM